MRKMAVCSTLILLCALPALAAETKSNNGSPAEDTPAFIAGTAPSTRPVGAPTLSAVAREARWYQRALTGVVTPYPASLNFLADQGDWYTPFTQPGMTGRYDLRRWHH